MSISNENDRHSGVGATEESSGLGHGVAQSRADVLEAWGLVYRSYRRAGLIEPNESQLHTVAEAVGPQTAVMCGRVGPVLASTLSAYIDTEVGLPLDSVYRVELDEMRNQGHRLCEVGLFADRREHMSRSIDSLFELMRFAYFYGRQQGVTQIVVGVHPRHSGFYRRLIGFEPAGTQRSYDTVRGHPVVLLRLDMNRGETEEKLPRGLRYFQANPVGFEAFDRRFDFDAASLRHGPLEPFLTPANATQIA